ncbi:MAG TPA: aldolase/citrate lyase family protein [Gemmataceae bacterium]|nr:aldolase/citrate lyase family protein [Gemmataceae bacterium]
MRANPVKKALKEGRPSVGTWLSLGSILAARFMARAGFDWLTVDVEHSLVDWETATHLFAAIADAGCTALARVPSNRHENVKRALDNGAHGIVFPMVCSRQEALDAVSACLYPPRGTRSVGGSAHALNFGTTAPDYYAHANDEILIVVQCEHIRAVEGADSIFSVPGIDAVFVGPNDLAASMRSADGRPPAPEAFKQALADILAGCKRTKVAAGIHTFSAEEAKTRIEEGWQFIAVGSELKMMLGGASAVINGLGLHRPKGELAKY